MTKIQMAGVAVVGVLVLILLVIGTADLVNRYQEGHFTDSQAALQKQLADEKANALAKQALADRAAEEGAKKDAEIQQLKTANETLAKAAGEKQVVYINARKPVPVRPFNGNATDADVRAAATGAGLVIRPAP